MACTYGPGARDVERAAETLAEEVPRRLAPLARLAFDYRWSWSPGGEALFAAVEPYRWEVCAHNPVRLFQETSARVLRRAAGDRALVRRARALERHLRRRDRPQSVGGIAPERPVAFFCAEYGLHRSLPIYAGGLGVLAGDLLKAASDRGLPLVGVGLLYREGYFLQRIDVTGWQHEYWTETDPERRPAALVTNSHGEPLVVPVPLRGREVAVQVWRVNVGRVPLYLLDTDRPENALVDRWITRRLYDGSPDIRLAQYGILGLGGVRALRAMGIEPRVLHLNEGHAALAPLEWAAGEVARGRGFEAALAEARRRTAFTTHTPVAAGNETYRPEELRHALEGLPERLGTDWPTLLRLGRVEPGASSEPFGTTPLALRLSCASNGVSRRHGEVARAMWRPAFRAWKEDEVPIGSVTNGVHVSTWMAEPIRELLDRHLGEGWQERGGEPGLWKRFDALPDEELWAARCRQRARLVELVRERATLDRLARGEAAPYVELAARAFDPDRLTIGFARRLATYKRLHLLSHDLRRALHLLAGERPVQIVLAGKAHPQDEEAKRVVRDLFRARGAPHVGERIAYLHDYDMHLARSLVAGCDVWLNLPRPPLEASGTSGMKAGLNGALHLSVLDGWWAEAYDGTHGWAIDGATDEDPAEQDDRHAAAMLEILEEEVVPCFHDRDAAGLPRAWLRRVKAALRAAARDFSARRMLGDYLERVYAPAPRGEEDEG